MDKEFKEGLKDTKWELLKNNDLIKVWVRSGSQFESTMPCGRVEYAFPDVNDPLIIVNSLKSNERVKWDTSKDTSTIL